MTSDWIALILKLAGLQSVILFFFLLGKRKRLPGAPLLIAGILILGANCWLQSAESTPFYVANPHLIRLDWGLNLLLFPCFYLFVQRYFGLDRLSKQDFWHFAPYLVHLLLMQSFLWQSDESKIQTLDYFGINPSRGIDVYRYYYYGVHLGASLLGMGYSMQIYKRVQVVKQELKSSFSSARQVRLQWLLPWIYLLLVFALAYFVVALFLPQQDYLWIDIERWFYLGAFILIYGISYQLFSHPLPDIGKSKVPEDPPAKSNLLSDTRAKELLSELETCFATDKPYLEPEIKSSDLAARLHLNRHELSELLNQHLGKNFYDLINTYRIEEVKKKLLDPKSQAYTILALAFDSGFNSKTTFNTLFKKYTGMTPSQFRKKGRMDPSERSGP